MASIVAERFGRSDESPEPDRGSGHGTRRPLHRIATVRREQGMSLRIVAKQLGRDVAQVKWQEQETSDLRLSDLRDWQQVLDVPLVDLLDDPGSSLSRPVLERARLVRIMKTVQAIRQRSKSVVTRRLAAMLVEQLVEIMPELADVSPWHAVGKRRSLNDLGRIVERQLTEEFFCRDDGD